MSNDASSAFTRNGSVELRHLAPAFSETGAAALKAGLCHLNAKGLAIVSDNQES